MKKITTIILSLVTLVSCNCEKSFDYVTASGTNVESALLKRMERFNDSIMDGKQSTRSFVQPGAWRRAQIIAADCGGAWSGGKAGAWAGGYFGPQGAALGATFGALLCGVSSSYVAWECHKKITMDENPQINFNDVVSLHKGDDNFPLIKDSFKKQTRVASLQSVDFDKVKENTIRAYVSMENEDPNYSDYLPREINVHYPITNNDVILMGAKHNAILKKLLNNEVIDNNKELELSEEQLEIVNSKEFVDSFNKTIDNVCKSIESDNIISNDENDISSKLMNMFYEILVKYPEDLSDTEFIINEYIEAVRTSTEISEEDKELIYAGLSVAASSSEFWNAK